MNEDDESRNQHDVWSLPSIQSQIRGVFLSDCKMFKRQNGQRIHRIGKGCESLKDN